MTGRLEQREYQTREGEKRTAIEVVADELGPSQRWATAQVERTTRTTEGGQGGQGGAPSGAPSGANRPSAEPYYGGDEEPF